jgi:hypothetical protein
VCVARNVLIVNILGENAQMEMYFKILQKNATNVYVVMETSFPFLQEHFMHGADKSLNFAPFEYKTFL